MFLTKSIPKFMKLMVLTLSLCVVASCGIYKKTDARKVPASGMERAEKNIQEGKGSGFSTLTKIKGVVCLILLLQTLCGELPLHY